MATKSKKQSVNKTAKFQPPKGYTVCASAGNTATHDWEKNPVLEGEVLEIKNVTTTAVDKKTGKKKKNETRLMVVKTKNGDEVAVWEKYQLIPLFDSVEKGSDIYIAHTGVKNIGGGQKMHEFTTAFR